MPTYDVCIVGAGIVGLATVYEYHRRNPDKKIVILEKESGVATHQTGHNSGVIHSGIYYKPESLKAKNCRDGVRRLLAFCDTHDIPYDLCGKLIIATDEEELPRLQKLYERGIANDVPELRLIDRDEIREYEPHATGLKAILSPSTGIIDFSMVADVLYKEIIDSGGKFRLNHTVTNIRYDSHQNAMVVETDKNPVFAHQIVNCGGLYSDRLAKMTETDPGVKIIPFRGEYYTLASESSHLVHNLIYPVPDPRFPFLGVHFTRGMDGKIEAGPNAVLAWAREGYRKRDVNPGDIADYLLYTGFWSMARQYWQMGVMEIWRSHVKTAFVKSLQRLVPEITGDDLRPGGAGVRAQALKKNGSLIDDFYIIQHPGIIHVLNAPSPAATSAFAIGNYITNLL